jgi:hypothetical protein
MSISFSFVVMRPGILLLTRAFLVVDLHIGKVHL